MRVRRPDVVQVQYTVLPAFPAKTSLVVNNPWSAKTPLNGAEQNGQITITTARLQIRVNKATNAVAFSSNWDAATNATLLKYDRLCYRLFPYIYSLAGRVTRENYPLVRSLAFDFRQNKNVYGIPDQYMFGPAFLVNPVTEQLYSGPKAGASAGTRPVYLPAAAK